MHALSFFPNSLFQLVTKEQKRNKLDPHQMVFSLTRSLPIVLIFCFRTHTQTHSRVRTLALTKLENDYGVVGNRRFSLRFPSLEGYWNEMQTFLRSINTLSTLCVIGWIFFSLSLSNGQKKCSSRMRFNRGFLNFLVFKEQMHCWALVSSRRDFCFVLDPSCEDTFSQNTLQAFPFTGGRKKN